MQRIALFVILLLHGLIHVMGFIKAYKPEALPQMAHGVSRGKGLVWLVSVLLFIAVAIMVLLKQQSWWWLGLIAVGVSQLLITGTWQDTKWGTIANAIVLVAAILAWGSWSFEKKYTDDVKAGLASEHDSDTELLTEADIAHMPAPVQRYLRYTGSLNKPKVHNAYIVCEGEMRSKTKDWFRFRSEQYNFLGRPTRLFFMKGKMFGTEVPGYHAYKNGDASMDVRLYGLIKVAAKTGREMNVAETVTYLNDLCLMIPAGLIDKRIEWKELDDLTVEASIRVEDIRVSARLHFDRDGKLINFISEDRYEVNDMKRYIFSTPLKQYGDFHGYRLVSYGEGCWTYPEGIFSYGKFYIRIIRYNVRE